MLFLSPHTAGGLNGPKGQWCKNETTCREMIKAKDPALYQLLKKIWSPEDQPGRMLAYASKNLREGVVISDWLGGQK